MDQELDRKLIHFFVPRAVNEVLAVKISNATFLVVFASADPVLSPGQVTVPRVLKPNI